MRVGSIVHCIDNTKLEDLVKLKTDYTIREIIPKGTHLKSQGHVSIITGEALVRLEEIKPDIVAYNCMWIDVPFPITRFKELMPPEAVRIEELMQEPIKEFA